MPYRPHLATVIDSARISPSFQRVRLSGLDTMGPSGAIRDLRIKLILPGPHGLAPLADAADWYAAWQALDPATRGHMRTYSVRDLDRAHGILTIDVVLHTAPGTTGPASAWAATARPGDQIFVIAPEAGDAPGPGIEFDPGQARTAHLFGDETALPALARIAHDWPDLLSGTISIEVPYFQDAQPMASRRGLTVEFLPRGDRPHGCRLVESLAQRLGVEPPTDDPADSEAVLWDTAASPTPRGGEYWWIAGESGVVKRMRRMLVRGAGVDKRAVSFMGYWRRGAAEG